MSQEIDLCGESETDNGERTTSASGLSLPLSRKRLRDKEASVNYADLRNGNGPGQKKVTGSAEFVVDLELADEVEASPHKKRRVVGKRAQALEGVEATERDAGSEDAQATDHSESHEGIAAVAAASHPMNSDSEQTSRNDGCANDHSVKLSTSKPSSNASGRQCCGSIWEGRLRELADYCKEHGHCNIPRNSKLGTWVANQRRYYSWQAEGKTSSMTLSRIRELEKIGFKWNRSSATVWEDRFSELADYRKIHGDCNVPKKYSKNIELGKWVANQRNKYRLQADGKSSFMTTFRFRELEKIGFKWRLISVLTAWKDRLSELADYRKIHGHCNVPCNYSESSMLANWVGTQRTQYRLHLEGKRSRMTQPRIQELEGIGFEWRVCATSKKLSTSKPPSHVSGRQYNGASWEGRLRELADYSKEHGHCNIPRSSSENSKLRKWVANQRNKYRLQLDGKTSSMTLSRIRELEKIGFKWRLISVLTAWEDRLSELANYRKIHGHCNVPYNYSENSKLANWVGTQRTEYRLYLEGKRYRMTQPRIQELEGIGFEWRVCATSEKLSTSKPPSNALGRQCNVSTWEDRLRELADYSKEHGHCNIPRSSSENSKLGTWVGTQRSNYRLHLEGKKSAMTTFRIQELEKIGFEWNRFSTTWQDRFCELAAYREIHGHCNVPRTYSENIELGNWVAAQRTNYKLHLNGKTSSATLSRIQELESLGFEWEPSTGRGEGARKKRRLDDLATRVHEKPASLRQSTDSQLETAPSNGIL
jgi:transposase-like protein